MTQEIQSCPEELKQYFIQEDNLNISKTITLLSKRYGTAGNALSRGL